MTAQRMVCMGENNDRQYVYDSHFYFFSSLIPSSADEALTQKTKETGKYPDLPVIESFNYQWRG